MFTVTNLISEAYYDSSVVSREFETIQGYQLSNGLIWLNQILGDKATDSGDIPYITQQYPFTGIVGQEMYFIPNLISIDALVFYIGSVRYQMNYVDRIKYFGAPRANNINALPVSYTYERVFGGCNIWVYFWPQQAFLFNITGNFFMPPVSLNQDLSTQVASANLGQLTNVGNGTIPAGQLVINGVDLAGAYGSTQTGTNLAAAINADVPFVTATWTPSQFTLLGSQSNANIIVSTAGKLASSTNYVNFSYFNMISGNALSQTYFAQGFDQFYIDYLEYQLAERICQKFNFSVPEPLRQQLDRYRLMINKMAEPLDLRQQKISVLGDLRAINYAQANIGRGYTVSGF